MITITTVLKSGNRYDASWVEKLKNNLERHMTQPYVFLPLSDAKHDYPSLSFVQENEKYWNKIELFRPDILNGPTLFLDLDTVILNDPIPALKSMSGNDFLMFRSRTNKGTPVPVASSCIMYWEKKPKNLWEIWNSQSKEYWYKQYAGGRMGDQAFIRDHAEYKFLQDVSDPEYYKYAVGNEPENFDKSIFLIFGGSNRKPDLMDWKVIDKEWKL